jgi:hypothetical protein
MKNATKIILFGLTLGLLACKYSGDKTVSNQVNQFDCNSLSDKKVIYSIAKSIIDKHDNEQIWNLYEIDTTDFLSIEDYFTNTRSKNRLVLIGGRAGMSSGTADNLLILFSCSDTFHVVWAGQVGDFKQSDIKDLDGDGIKEIVCNSGMIWMGECDENYNIFNFKNGKQNLVYSAHSTSFIDCGKDNFDELFKLGDTLEHKFDCLLLKTKDNEYSVQQIQTSKIHNGGHTDEEIIKNLKVNIDTTTIGLK